MTSIVKPEGLSVLAAVAASSHPQVTPFLLERIRQLTGGKSLEANVKLVKHNAAVGAAVAVAYSQLSKDSMVQQRSRL